MLASISWALSFLPEALLLATDRLTGGPDNYSLGQHLAPT